MKANILICILAILILVCNFRVKAQELNVKSLSMVMEPMTVSMQKKDLNGVVCPLVKVQLPIDGCKFEGNVIDVRFDVSEYYVYMSPNSKILSIKCPGYKPFKVYFEDFNLTVESKKIYALDIDLTQHETKMGVNSLPENSRSGDEETWLLYCDENNRFGFYDSEYNVKIPARYEDAYDFHEGLAAVKINGKWGFIDKDDNLVIDAKYVDFDQFRNGHACVKNEYGMRYAIDKSGKQITQWYKDIDGPYENIFRIKEDGKYGFVDCNGNEIIPPKYDKVSRFENGLAYAEIDGKCGIININGEEVIPLIYDDLEEGENGWYSVCKQGKYGYIDTKGNTKINFIYDEAEAFDEYGYAAVYKKDRCCVIDTNGKIVMRTKYEDMEAITDGSDDSWYSNMFVASKKDKYGIIDNNNKVIVPFIYDDIIPIINEGLIKFEKEGLFGYMNTSGAIVINPEFDKARGFFNNIAFVSKQGKWGAINKDGKPIIPFIYEDIDPYHDMENQNMLSVKYNGMWGMIDNAGKAVVPFRFDSYISFSGERAVCNKGKLYYLINKNGDKVSEWVEHKVLYK